MTLTGRLEIDSTSSGWTPGSLPASDRARDGAVHLGGCLDNKETLDSDSKCAHGAPLRLGLDTLLSEHPEWLAGRRVGLVSHRAAVDASGVTTAERLRGAAGVNLVALFGPEHGFAGAAAAGERTSDYIHETWRIPVFSLYSDRRQPTAEMLSLVDVLVYDVQDLGARPYTYVATLKLVLEAAAACRKPVVIADRPVPLARSADGPALDRRCESFVGCVPTPMQYGLTPGETALWLRFALALDLDLNVATLDRYSRCREPHPDWPPWVPPSPRIRSWESACLFTATVAGEALPALDYGSGTELSFQLLGAPWLDAAATIAALEPLALPGVGFEPQAYEGKTGRYAGARLAGLRLRVTDYASFRPVRTCVAILSTLQALYGRERLWAAEGTRPDFFDKLFGTATVREALLDGETGAQIANRWRPDLDRFLAARAPFILYQTALV